MVSRSVILLGPALHAVSGVSTHVRQLLGSDLAHRVRLWHFQVGSEGRSERGYQKILRVLASPVSLAAVILRQRADVVHLNTSLLAKSYWRDLMYVLVARVLRRKIVYQVHGGRLPQDFFAGNAILTAVLMRTLRACNVIVVLAEAELDAYRRFVPEKRILIIPNAIEPTDFAGGKRVVRASEPLRLAYLGRITRDKGVFEIVEAMRILKDRGVQVQLSIAGSGAEEISMREAVTQAGLEGQVRFYSPVFGPEKRAFWAETDIFLFPTYREGLPYSLLESMASGVVPIACAVGAIPDVVRNEVHGLLVPPRDPRALADAVATLNADRVRLTDMADAACSRVASHYSVGRLTEDLSRLYGSL
jgi:glycosyltransferase involved in cell wall biosynthesis